MDFRARQRRALPALFGEIQRARAALRDAHHLGGSAVAARGKERQLHTALNDYAVALGALSLPVPVVIRDELRIYRELLAVHLDSRPGRGR